LLSVASVTVSTLVRDITTRLVSEGVHHHNPKRPRGSSSSQPEASAREFIITTRGVREGVHHHNPKRPRGSSSSQPEASAREFIITTRSVSEGSRVRKSQRYSGLSGQDTRPAHLPRVGARDCAPSSTTPCLVDPSRTLRVVKKPRKIRSSTVIDSKNATSKTKRLEFINNQ
jgi:hypothetical protein